MRAKRPLDASGGTAEVPSALPKSRLLDYRAAVDDLVNETSRHPRTSDLLAAEELIAKRLGEPEFADVLWHLTEPWMTSPFGQRSDPQLLAQCAQLGERFAGVYPDFFAFPD